MKPQGHLFKLLIVMLALVRYQCFSQRSILQMNDSTGLHAYALRMGDTLVVKYDSAYLLNKKTFKRYDSTYKKVQDGNAAFITFLKDYDELNYFKDSLIRLQNKYYDSLKSNVDILNSVATTFFEKSSGNINSMDSSMSKAAEKVTEIKSSLEESVKGLRQQIWKKFKLVLGGFTVGFGVSTIIFLISR